jgi:hypothetical protein
MRETFQKNGVQQPQFEQAVAVIGMLNAGDYQGALSAARRTAPADRSTDGPAAARRRRVVRAPRPAPGGRQPADQRARRDRARPQRTDAGAQQRQQQEMQRSRSRPSSKSSRPSRPRSTTWTALVKQPAGHGHRLRRDRGAASPVHQGSAGRRASESVEKRGADSVQSSQAVGLGLPRIGFRHRWGCPAADGAGSHRFERSNHDGRDVPHAVMSRAQYAGIAPGTVSAPQSAWLLARIASGMWTQRGVVDRTGGRHALASITCSRSGNHAVHRTRHFRRRQGRPRLLPRQQPGRPGRSRAPASEGPAGQEEDRARRQAVRRRAAAQVVPVELPVVQRLGRRDVQPSPDARAGELPVAFVP